jgi:hypothetical protein
VEQGSPGAGRHGEADQAMAVPFDSRKAGGEDPVAFPLLSVSRRTCESSRGELGW